MADRKDPREHIQHHIECSVCFLVYNNTDRKPKTLPCGHTFCEVCLQTLVKSKGSTISCPQDRSQITIPSGGVSDLPTSFSILSMADNACDECHAKPKKVKCVLNHCQKTLCEGCFDEHCELIRGSLKTSLKELRDEMNTLQAECDDDEDVHLLEDQCSEAIEAVNLICDELKQNLVQKMKERVMSDKENLFKWKMDMGLRITRSKNFIRESMSKLSTATSSASTIVMGDIQKKVLSEKHNIHAEKEKPVMTSFHPEKLKQEFKAMLPNLLLILITQLSIAAQCKVSNVGIPDYSSAKFKCMYGSKGAGEDHLNSPFGLCCSPTTGYLAIVDWLNHRICILNSKLKHLLTFGSEGNGENQYKYPVGITVNSKGNLFITDTDNHRIQIISSDGQYINHFGTEGSGKGQYNEPWGISCDEDDLLHICDRKNYRIQIVKENGEFVRFIGCEGDNPGEFEYSLISIICSKVHDRVIVTDGNCNIHFFTHRGQFIKTIKALQPPYNMYANCVAIDHIGNVIIGDDNRNCLVVLGPDGDLLCTVGGPGDRPGQFNQPMGIAVTKDGCLYVSDSENHRVQLLHVPIIAKS